MSLDELRTLIARRARPDMSTPVDGVLLSKVESGGPPEVSMTGTVLAVVVQGGKRIALGDRVLEYRAGQYLIASVDLPVTGHFLNPSRQHPALGFGLVLRPADVAEVLLQAGQLDQPARTPAVPGLAVSDSPPELLDAVLRLVRLLDHPRDRAVLAPLVIKEILWRVITGDQGATVRQLGLESSGLRQISAAVHWIRANYTESFRVQEVAARSGMSVSAFHRNFHAVTAMSPIQFQKQIRLQEARLLLATRPADITGVSYQVGYDSPSQFSREYRRQFGAPPSRDAARLRNSAGTP